MLEIEKSALEGVLILDLEGTVTYLNSAACELFGIEEDQALGNSLAGRIRGLDWESLVEQRRVISRDLEVTYPDQVQISFQSIFHKFLYIYDGTLNIHWRETVRCNGSTIVDGR